jgi:hypothetical protein
MRRAAARDLAAVAGPPDEPAGDGGAEDSGGAGGSGPAPLPVTPRPPVPPSAPRPGERHGKPAGGRKLSGPGKASGRLRRYVVIAGGAAALAVVLALLAPQNQGSGAHPRALATANTRRASSAPPQVPAAKPPPSPAPGSAKRTTRSHPGRRAAPARPAYVPAARVSPAPGTQPSVTPAPQRPAAPSGRPPAPASFAALAGPGCPGGADAGISIDSTWYAQSGGGWTGSGCSGMYYAKWVHEPGSDTVRTFTWWFRTGLAGSATCRVSVYVPDGDSTTVGADPAPYEVYTGSSDSDAVGTFSLDQLHNHGEWLYAGAFPARGGQFSVQVANVGSGSVEVAADTVRVYCAL